MKHPAFDIKNPNRVRALVGAFSANQLRFHAADGAGYAPGGRNDPHTRQDQSAGRRAHGGRVRNLAALRPVRQALMRHELTKLSKLPGLSSNLFEVVTKMLE